MRLSSSELLSIRSINVDCQLAQTIACTLTCNLNPAQKSARKETGFCVLSKSKSSIVPESGCQTLKLDPRSLSIFPGPNKT